MRNWYKMGPAVVAVSLFVMCSDSLSDSIDDSLYLASNLPNNFKVNIPDSIQSDSASASQKSKFARQEGEDFEGLESDRSGLHEIKDAVAGIKRVLFEEGVEIEYLMMDLFYEKAAAYLENNPEEDYVPGGAFEVEIPQSLINRLKAGLSDVASESEIKELLRDFDIKAGDNIENPMMAIEDVSDDDDGYDIEVSYTWDFEYDDEDYDDFEDDEESDGAGDEGAEEDYEEPASETIIAFDNEKTRVRISYVEEGDEDELGMYDWNFTYSFDSVERTQTLRESLESEEFEYFGVLSLRECADNTGDCVELMLTSAEEDEFYSEYVEVFGVADDNGGFLQEHITFDDEEEGEHESEIFREEFDGSGNLTAYWYGEETGDGIVWYDSGDNEVEGFDSEYFSIEFDDGFDIGLAEVTVCGGTFTGGSLAEIEFVIVYNPAGGDISADDEFEEKIFGGGFYYWESEGGETFEEKEAVFWEDEELLSNIGNFQVYTEDYSGGDFTYALQSDVTLTEGEVCN